MLRHAPLAITLTCIIAAITACKPNIDASIKVVVEKPVAPLSINIEPERTPSQNVPAGEQLNHLFESMERLDIEIPKIPKLKEDKIRDYWNWPPARPSENDRRPGREYPWERELREFIERVDRQFPTTK